MATATRFEELVCWKLAEEARTDIFRLTESGAAARDFDFKDQIRRSSRSATSNLAEGFGAFQPREFARLARIARRSIMETRTHLYEARTQAYWPEPDVERLIKLTVRAQSATTALIKYLDSCKGRPPTGWDFGS